MRKRSFTREEIENLCIQAYTHIGQIDRLLDSLFPPTLREAKQRARLLGCSLTLRDGEYRVAPLDAHLTPARKEALAGYASDVLDALALAQSFADGRKRRAF